MLRPGQQVGHGHKSNPGSGETGQFASQRLESLRVRMTDANRLALLASLVSQAPELLRNQLDIRHIIQENRAFQGWYPMAACSSATTE